MCRRQELYGFCLIFLGIGMLLGHWLRAWLIAVGGGAAFIVLGIMLMRRR